MVITSKFTMMYHYQNNFEGVVNYMGSKIVGLMSMPHRFQMQTQETQLVVEVVKVTVGEDAVAEALAEDMEAEEVRE